MPGSTVRVKGLRGLQRDLRRADKVLAKDLRSELKQAGDLVRVAATELFSRYDSRSASGYRTRVRQGSVAVEQSIPRTTGLRPDYGALQMRRALVPALDEKAGEVERSLERMLDGFGREIGF